MTPTQETDVQLTDFRKKLSSLEHAVKAMLDTKLSPRPETTLALRNIQRAIMWLGKCKGALNIRSPYPQSFNADNKVIEPRADQSEAFQLPEYDEVKAVKAVRFELNKMEDIIWSAINAHTDIPKYQLAINEAYISCCDATMCLGMTLNAIFQENSAVEKILPREKSIKPEAKTVDLKPTEGESTETTANLPSAGPTNESENPPPPPPVIETPPAETKPKSASGKNTQGKNRNQKNGKS